MQHISRQCFPPSIRSVWPSHVTVLFSRVLITDEVTSISFHNVSFLTLLSLVIWRHFKQSNSTVLISLLQIFQSIAIFHLRKIPCDVIVVIFPQRFGGSKNQKIRRLLRNPNVHYRVHNSPPLDPILGHMSPIQILTPYFFKIYFNIILHLRYSSQAVSSLLVFRLKFHTCNNVLRTYVNLKIYCTLFEGKVSLCLIKFRTMKTYLSFN
jgi:hypothetical protein